MINAKMILRDVVEEMYKEETGLREAAYENYEWEESQYAKELLTVEKLENIIYNNIENANVVVISNSKGMKIDALIIKSLGADMIKRIISQKVEELFEEDGGEFAFPNACTKEKFVAPYEDIKKHLENVQGGSKKIAAQMLDIIFIIENIKKRKGAMDRAVAFIKDCCQQMFTNNAMAYDYLAKNTDGNFAEAMQNGYITVMQIAGYYLFNNIALLPENK